MSSVGRRSAIGCLVLVFFVLLLVASDVSAQNVISGTIYDKSNNPLPDIDVELLDEYHRTVRNGRQKTGSTGRYEFGGLNDGRYYVRVFAFRYDLQDAESEVYVSSVSAIPGQQGTSFNLQDFYLQPKKGGMRETELSVVFAQNVPKAAEAAYKQAIDDISKKREDEGFAGLQKAIELFPTYYQALMLIGTELVLRQQYLAAAQAYLKAGEVNPKSAQAFYRASFSLFQLGDKYHRAALRPVQEAAKLAPASAPVLLLLGSIERRLGMLEPAEQHLLQAKKVSTVPIAEIHRELAQLYDSLKKYRQAADELENYMKASKMSDEDKANIQKIITGLRAKAQTAT